MQLWTHEWILPYIFRYNNEHRHFFIFLFILQLRRILNIFFKSKTVKEITFI